MLWIGEVPCGRSVLGALEGQQQAGGADRDLVHLDPEVRHRVGDSVRDSVLRPVRRCGITRKGRRQGLPLQAPLHIDGRARDPGSPAFGTTPALGRAATLDHRLGTT